MLAARRWAQCTRNCRREWGSAGADNARPVRYYARFAERLGFQYEGILRQNWVRYGRNRDNVWFSIVDSELPDSRAALKDA